VLFWFVHRNTRLGQYLRFSGEHPEALQSQGVSVTRVRWTGVLLAGVLCGIAGAYLSIDHGSGFARNMTAGRGYIALAALIIGCWTPLGAVLAALAFGAIEASQILLQGTTLWGGHTVPVQWIQMLPYIATLIILAGAAGGRLIHARAPKALGRAI
jgi:simple sugar transport system permease protein